MKKNQLLQKLLLLVSLFPLCSFCFAQVTEEWVKRYNGPPGTGRDAANSVAVDASGYVYVTGESGGIGSDQDYVTIKYKPLGTKIWKAKYNGPGNDRDQPLNLVVDASGNVYVTGRSKNKGTVLERNYDYATVKYNSEGVQQWVARYNGPGNDVDEAFGLAVDGSGNVYVTGGSIGAGSYYDYATIKYNAAGVQQWVVRYNGPGNNYDRAFDLALDPGGNVYITGRSENFGLNGDCTTIKYNSEGVQQWLRRYNGPDDAGDSGFGLALDPGGNVYVTGNSRGIGTMRDIVTIKYTEEGVQLWVARYNGPGNDDDQSAFVDLDASQNVYVTGFSIGSGTDYDYATIKYNKTGVRQWVSRYNGPANFDDKAFSQVVDGSGNVYVTGHSRGIGTSYDYATIKYNTSGVQQWLARYNGPDNLSDGAGSLVVDASGNVYVTGGSTGLGTEYDYATIKYSQPPTIAARTNPSEINIDLPSRFRVSNYPNPVSAIARIEYEIPFDGQVAIKVYDVLGREVTTLVNAGMKAGYHSTDFNASSIQNGVYYYKIIVNTEKKIFKESGKIIVVK